MLESYRQHVAERAALGIPPLPLSAQQTADLVQLLKNPPAGEEEFLLSENESTYLPVGITHRLENPGKVPLEVIEVQSGSYLGEDDIVRFEDVYKRS